MFLHCLVLPRVLASLWNISVGMRGCGSSLKNSLRTPETAFTSAHLSLVTASRRSEQSRGMFNISVTVSSSRHGLRPLWHKITTCADQLIFTVFATGDFDMISKHETELSQQLLPWNSGHTFMVPRERIVMTSVVICLFLSSHLFGVEWIFLTFGTGIPGPQRMILWLWWSFDFSEPRGYIFRSVWNALITTVWHFLQTFMAPRRWTLLTLVIIHLF